MTDGDAGGSSDGADDEDVGGCGGRCCWEGDVGDSHDCPFVNERRGYIVLFFWFCQLLNSKTRPRWAAERGEGERSGSCRWR